MKTLSIVYILLASFCLGVNITNIPPQQPPMLSIGNVMVTGRFTGDGGGLTNLNLTNLDLVWRPELLGIKVEMDAIHTNSMEEIMKLGMAVTNYMAEKTVSSAKSTRKAFYLAPRTDGADGSGTFNDPWNASTTDKLALTWNRLIYSDLTWPEGATITFMPGDYYLSRQLDLAVGGKNLTLSGYGARLYLTNASFTGIGMSAICTRRFIGGGNPNTVIQGFDIDIGTYLNFGAPGSVNGVFVEGDHCTVRDVTVRNIQSLGAYESFGIIFGSSNGIISGCSVLDLKDGGGTGIVFGGYHNVATGNLVDLGGVGIGASVYGHGNVVQGNIIRNCEGAFCMDGAGAIADGTIWRDNLITGNHFSASWLAIRVENNNQGFENWTFANNVIDSQQRWLSLWTGDAWKSNKVTGFRFIGNQFTGPVAKVAPVANMVLQNFKSHSFINNEFSVPPTIIFGTNANTIYGAGNTVGGIPNNSAFGVK